MALLPALLVVMLLYRVQLLYLCIVEATQSCLPDKVSFTSSGGIH